MTIAYAIMPIGKKRCEYPCGHTKSPGVPAPGLFYSVLARWFIPSGWLPLLVSIQPFANIVGNYTCRNGDKKRCKNIHANTPPFSTGLGRGSMAMITWMDRVMQYRLYFKWTLNKGLWNKSLKEIGPFVHAKGPIFVVKLTCDENFTQ